MISSLVVKSSVDNFHNSYCIHRGQAAELAYHYDRRAGTGTDSIVGALVFS